ncbi:ankyrin repeat domain-containing protein [Robertkochia flava]|uniref:ankyrin repeat domain-containing protein n=1 Tax=Robertkochia flava TaxID=3447986 RepID=UPI001CCECC97|nr:ankyrin repeat domain-containing protein [Robertkochia marina]
MKTLTVLAALLFAVTTQANYEEPVSLHTGISDPVTETASYNLSPFCFAIAKGDYDTVKKLIELGADINSRSRGLTPLMYAAKFNRVEITKLLLENGADTKAKDRRLDFTAYKYAEISNAKDVMKVLKDS